ncbi:hypothetical protein GCM10027162_39650 [Streptomyces incanus]
MNGMHFELHRIRAQELMREADAYRLARQARSAPPDPRPRPPVVRPGRSTLHRTRSEALDDVAAGENEDEDEGIMYAGPVGRSEAAVRPGAGPSPRHGDPDRFTRTWAPSPG